MKYLVTISDSYLVTPAMPRPRIHRVHGLSLAQAWRVAERHARRGAAAGGETSGAPRTSTTAGFAESLRSAAAWTCCGVADSLRRASAAAAV